jgi:23S rRNA (adenine-N6)-dimethyltransferase
MKRDFRFSQNFLHSPELVKRLIEKTNISSYDTVYDIGSGKGIITVALATYCRTVVAIEADPKLAHALKEKIKSHSNILVYQGNFLNMPLPKTPYKVFASIPYNFSADIVHKLLDSNLPPSSCYLIVQQEFAKKLIGNSQLAILTGVSFKVKILQELDSRDFHPVPRVKSVLIEITKRHMPLVKENNIQFFRDFVVYAFNSFRPTLAQGLNPIFSNKEFEKISKKYQFNVDATPTQLSLEQWLGLFEEILNKNAKVLKQVKNYEAAYQRLHRERSKTHRSTAD